MVIRQSINRQAPRLLPNPGKFFPKSHLLANPHRTPDTIPARPRDRRQDIVLFPPPQNPDQRPSQAPPYNRRSPHPARPPPPPTPPAAPAAARPENHYAPRPRLPTSAPARLASAFPAPARPVYPDPLHRPADLLHQMLHIGPQRIRRRKPRRPHSGSTSSNPNSFASDFGYPIP